MYIQLFIEFFTLGLFTFGGGTAMLATLQDRMEKRQWMEQEEILDCLVLSQTLPGVVGCNMSCYVGYRMKGFMGAVVSVIAMMLPSFVIIILIATVLDSVCENVYVQGALMGIRAAATGLIAYVCLKLARQVGSKLKGSDKVFGVIMMLASFVIIAALGVSAAWVILASIVIGIAYFMIIKNHIPSGKGGEDQ